MLKMTTSTSDLPSLLVAFDMKFFSLKSSLLSWKTASQILFFSIFSFRFAPSYDGRCGFPHHNFRWSTLTTYSREYSDFLFASSSSSSISVVPVFITICLPDLLCFATISFLSRVTSLTTYLRSLFVTRSSDRCPYDCQSLRVPLIPLFLDRFRDEVYVHSSCYSLVLRRSRWFCRRLSVASPCNQYSRVKLFKFCFFSFSSTYWWQFVNLKLCVRTPSFTIRHSLIFVCIFWPSSCVLQIFFSFWVEGWMWKKTARLTSLSSLSYETIRAEISSNIFDFIRVTITRYLSNVLNRISYVTLKSFCSGRWNLADGAPV